MTEIFVFGSNLTGRHGKGAALFAKKHHGAVYGVGQGLTGNSYATPTKDERIKTLPLHTIKDFVRTFVEFAKSRPDLSFRMTHVGCGLAGYKPEQIAPMFSGVTSNVMIPDEFLPFI
jgi:hypothetical protein